MERQRIPIMIKNPLTYLKKRHLLWAINFWPPIFGAGIRVKVLSPDLTDVLVTMKQRFWNTSFVSRHFGGSLYVMTDPFYMIMLLEVLGKGHSVIDKAASIRYLKAARGKVSARFKLTENEIKKIMLKLESSEKPIDWTFDIPIICEKGSTVAIVNKTLSLKKVIRQKLKKPKDKLKELLG